MRPRNSFGSGLRLEATKRRAEVTGVRASALRQRVTAAPTWAVLPAAAVALGLAVVGVAGQGTASRPVFATLILLGAGAAGLAPLRYAIPTGVLLAAFSGTVVDFFGSPGRYWKEAFVLGLVARSGAARRPSPLEVVLGLQVAGIYAAYAATGTRLLSVGWAAKILLLGVVAAWALGRRRPDLAAWRAFYSALVVAVGANMVLAVWQRLEGADGLVRLGLSYGERVRQAPGGDLRVFGGLTAPAPFAYAMALAALVWLAFLLGDARERRTALATAWVPVAATAGIALSLNRIALVALCAAIVVVALRETRTPRMLAAAAAAPVVLALVLAFGGSSARDFLLQGFSFGSESAKTRRAFWREYAGELSAFGAGPGSAGAAYERAPKRPAEAKASFLKGWQQRERESGKEFHWMGTHATLGLGHDGPPRRIALSFDVAALHVPRRVTVQVGGRTVARALALPDGYQHLRLTMPAQARPVLLRFRASPPAESATVVTPGDTRRLAIRVADLRALLLPASEPPAQRIYNRVRERLPSSALAGTSPGLVDNLYLSWLFQYGLVLGGALCLAWAGFCLWPLAGSSGPRSLLVSARLWGVFLIVAALVVNVWEEFPVDLLSALVLGQALAAKRWRLRRSRPARS